VKNKQKMGKIEQKIGNNEQKSVKTEQKERIKFFNLKCFILF
jgi:hypothetical protein